MASHCRFALAFPIQQRTRWIRFIPILATQFLGLLALPAQCRGGTVGGGGYAIHDGGRGEFNVVQNDPSNFNTDSGLAFSLMTSKDRAMYSPSSPVLSSAPRHFRRVDHEQPRRQHADSK